MDPTAGRFDVRVHHHVDHVSVRTVTTPIDTAYVSRLARVIATTLEKAPATFTKGRARFNFYVLPEPDSTLVVWLLPAWLPDGTALFGAELTYRFSADGGQLLSTAVIPGPIRATRPDSTAPFRIDSNAPDSPSVGDIFFLLLMRPHMSHIRIVTKRFSSSLIETGSQEAWVHVVRDTTRVP